MRTIYLATFLLLSIAKSFACSCDVIPTVENSFENADAIFVGTVISKKNISVKYESRNVIQIEYKIRLIKLFKGKKISEIISITTGDGRHDCGFMFEINKKYIVYAYNRNQYFDGGEIVKPFLSTNVCQRTAIYNLEEEKGLDQLIRKKVKKA